MVNSKGDDMKSGVLASFFAAVVAAVVAIAVAIILPMIGLVKPVGGPEWLAPDMMLLWIIVVIGLDVIWFTFLGILYVKFYDKIPGKGLLKGLIYAFLILLISNIRVASFQIAFWQCLTWVQAFNYPAFFIFFAYGLALGYLYKKE
jgi:hypothetical protein